MDEQARETARATPGSPTFEALWERYRRPLAWFVGGYLEGARDGDLARQVEDAVQEIMLKVYRSLERIDGRHATSTWVYTIARNHCIDLRRRSRTRGWLVARRVDPDTLAAPSGRGPEEQALARESAEQIDALIRELDPDDRTILMLRYYEDLPYAEIARTVGRPEGTVRYRVHVIKARLRDRLERQDAGEPDGRP